MPKNETLKNAIDSIKFTTKLNQAEIAKQLEIKSTYLSDMINGRVPFTESIKEKLYEIFSYSFQEQKSEETRPRIPMDAAAGSLSIALDGVTLANAEQIPLIKAFTQYDFTIYVRGDSMEPEFHAGDELACLYMKDASFIQWGRYHILDTKQGVLVKRIFEDEDYIVCKSDNSEFYKDFKIHKNEIYNMALVVGCIRRY